MPDPIPTPSLASIISPQPFVFLGMPHNGPIEVGASAGMKPRCDFPVQPVFVGGSILCHNFNQLWCRALDMRTQVPITHFAMLHSDVHPEEAWLAKLIDEMERTGADVLSVVSPIKSDSGHVSIAIDAPAGSDEFEIERVLTTTEVMGLPETFSAADCGFPDRLLLVNTGCWVCDFRKPWVEAAFFETVTAIKRDEAGAFIPKVMSEDWLFSRYVQRAGGKVLATRKASLHHVGAQRFPNNFAWGEATDGGKPALVLPNRKAGAA